MGRSIKKPRECGAWVVVWRLDLHFIGSVLRRSLIPLPELCKGGFVHNHNAALPHGIGVLVEHDQDRAALPCDLMVLVHGAHCRPYIADVVACRLSKPHRQSIKQTVEQFRLHASCKNGDALSIEEIGTDVCQPMISER